MQSGPPLEGEDELQAQEIWLAAAEDAVKRAIELQAMGVHKEVVNRLLEPFLWHTVIVTSTEWDNFFEQRDSDLAQPEIAVPAECIRVALELSQPETVPFEGWHLPYLTEEDNNLTLEEKRKVSVARCTRVSYLNHGKKRELEKDFQLYDNLISAEPPHWSPLEHIATPTFGESEGNFNGWAQLRHLTWHL